MTHGVHAHRRMPGFSVIELLIVIGIIVALMAITFPIVARITGSSEKQGTEALLRAVSTAIGNDTQRTVTVSVPTADRGRLGVSNADGLIVRRYWDFNNDGILDGDPRRDPAFAEKDRDLATLAGYTGAAARMSEGLRGSNLDSAGRIVDAWKNPLRIDFGGKDKSYGAHQFRVSSDGPDGIASNADDISSIGGPVE